MTAQNLQVNLAESTEQKKQPKEISWKSLHYLKYRSTESLGWLPRSFEIECTPFKKPHNQTTAPQRWLSVVLTISDYHWKSLAGTSQVFLPPRMFWYVCGGSGVMYLCLQWAGTGCGAERGQDQRDVNECLYLLDELWTQDEKPWKGAFAKYLFRLPPLW